MTLVISVITTEQAVMVSDRRLTSNGRLIDDESNKAYVLFVRNARLLVGYTGLARVSSFETEKWLPAALMKAASPDFRMENTIRRFCQAATAEIRQLKLGRQDRRLSFMFAGYCYDEDPSRAYFWLVSNFEDMNGPCEADGGAADAFFMNFVRDKRPPDKPYRAFIANGASQPVEIEQRDDLYDLLDRPGSGDAIAKKTVNLIRTAASKPSSQGLIGKQCMSIILPADATKPAVAAYHTARVSDRRYDPMVICALGDEFGVFAIGGGSLELLPGPTAVPATGRNKPCPCGSRIKFKRCHGKPGAPQFTMRLGPS